MDAYSSFIRLVRGPNSKNTVFATFGASATGNQSHGKGSVLMMWCIPRNGYCNTTKMNQEKVVRMHTKKHFVTLSVLESVVPFWAAAQRNPGYAPCPTTANAPHSPIPVNAPKALHNAGYFAPTSTPHLARHTPPAPRLTRPWPLAAQTCGALTRPRRAPGLCVLNSSGVPVPPGARLGAGLRGVAGVFWLSGNVGACQSSSRRQTGALRHWTLARLLPDRTFILAVIMSVVGEQVGEQCTMHAG